MIEPREPVNIRRMVTVGLSVRDLAESFSMLSADEQAQFFALVGEVMGDWEPHRREMQLHYMAREILDDKESREAFESIVESVKYLADHPRVP